MNTLIHSLHFALQTISHGPLYSLASLRARNPVPLDAQENWNFWTKQRGSLAIGALSSYPPSPVRKLLINSSLRQPHEVGIAAHYDVSNDFYRLFLDKKYMFYSCADFDRGTETLEEAQENKANFILNLIKPEPGEKILELGCGWGAMLRRVYEATGDMKNLFGYTLSREQFAFLKRSYGFNVSLKDFIDAEYEESSYDKIYSIGAWEHVRPTEVLPLFRKLYRALVPGGKLIQHFFCLSEMKFPTSMLMGQIFFPGSLLSSYTFHSEAWQRAGFRLTHESKHDYRPTLKAWYDNLAAQKDRALKLVDITTYNKYLVFFPLSWWVFNQGQTQVYRWVLEKPA